MLIKAGVDISRLKREIRRSLPRVEAVLAKHGEELILTSTYEGTHSAGSLHYDDNAYDLRDPREKKALIVTEIREALGPNYDVVAESGHIHIEYDPK